MKWSSKIENAGKDEPKVYTDCRVYRGGNVVEQSGIYRSPLSCAVLTWLKALVQCSKLGPISVAIRCERDSRGP